MSKYVNPIPKQKYKKHSRKSIHDFSESVKKHEYAEAKGLCRICQAEPITQYHHITEKGMGGGRGLGIQINCLGVGDRCHNHDDTEFLQVCDLILEERIDHLFKPESAYITSELDQWLKTDFNIIYHEIQKGFLKVTLHTSGNVVTTTDDIKRWLKGVA